MQTNLYDNSLYFALQFQDQTTNILQPLTLCIEPMNWDKLVNDIPRDLSWYAFWSDFMEDSYGLCFTFLENGGGEYLKNIYDTFGDQAVVWFMFGYTGHKPIKKWRVNLQDYELDYGSDISEFGGVLTSIEKMPFQGKLKARMSTPCQINAYINMDGDLLTPIPVQTVRLHSKTLLEETVASTQIPITLPESVPTFFDTYLIIQPDLTNAVIDELYQVFNQPTGILDTTSRIPASSGIPSAPHGSGIYTSLGPPDVLADPFLNNICQFNPSTSGLLEVIWSGGTVDTSFYWYKTGGLTHNYWGVTPRVVVTRLILGVWTVVGEYDGTTQIVSTFVDSGVHPTAPMIGSTPSATNLNTASTQYILPSVTGSSPRGNCNQCSGYTFNEDFINIQVEAGDCVYVHLLMCTNGTTKTANNAWVQVDQFVNDITFKQLTVTPGSTSDCYRAFDIITQQLENITGQKNALISNYYSEGGAGYNRVYTNGYGLRNFNALYNQPKKSLEAFLKDEQATYCLGVGIQELEGIEYLRIEYITDFFKPLVINTYENTFEWKEKHNKDFCFNKFEFGYNKWQGLNLIMEDEFNTKGDYLTQFLKYGDAMLSKMSDTIHAGYMIEEQRRNQFNVNPNQSLQEDETLFCINVRTPNIFLLQNPSFVAPIANNNPIISFGQLMFLQFGDAVKITFTGPGAYLGTMSFGIAQSEISTYPNDNYSIFTEGTWISGTTYGYNTIIYDNSGGGWYICYLAVTSSTPPNLDAAHWTAWIFLGYSGGYTIEVIAPAPNQLFSERNQPFQICSGVIDPSTIYNGRDSLKHILYNWAPIIGIGLYFIDPLSKDWAVSQIVTTLVRMNSKFTTKFNVDETFQGNVGQLTLNEFTREQISNIANYRLFSPIQGTCKIRIGWNEFEENRLALSGETGDETKDFGGLVLKDNKGEMWFCHVMDMKQNNYDEMCELNVQKVFKLR